MSNQITQLYQKAPGKITTKSLYTGEVKKIDNNDISTIIPTIEKVDLSVIRDSRLAPKQNYSKVDAQIININAHKGPDEVRYV